MSSTSEMRAAWAPACHLVAPVTLPFGTNGAQVTIDGRAAGAFRALDNVFDRHNYDVRKVDTGAFSCRLITGGSDFSLHAYGIAADVNWQSNPYGPSLVTNMPPAMILDVEAITARRTGRHVFRWGGRYSGNKDAMHFEIIIPPGELDQGVIDPKGNGLTEEEVKEILAELKKVNNKLDRIEASLPGHAGFLRMQHRLKAILKGTRHLAQQQAADAELMGVLAEADTDDD